MKMLMMAAVVPLEMDSDLLNKNWNLIESVCVSESTHCTHIYQVTFSTKVSIDMYTYSTNVYRLSYVLSLVNSHNRCEAEDYIFLLTSRGRDRGKRVSS